MNVRLVFFSVFALIYIQGSYAQVVINEFSAANYDDVADNYFEYEDWIELYNTSNATIDLSGYHLSDRMAEPTKFVIPAGVTIPANGHLLVWCSRRDLFDGNSLHTNFKLTQTRGIEAIIFADPSGTILDFHNIDIPNQKNHSRGRVSDGASTWGVFTNNSSPGNSNLNARQEYATTPGFNQVAGFYAGSVTVTISTPDPNVTTYYTTDGSDPNQGSLIYSAPLTFTNTTVLRAKSYSSDPSVPASFIKTKTFFVNENHTIPVISIVGTDLAPLMDGNFDEPEGHFELFDELGDRVSDAAGEFNKHGNDSWFYDQRGIDYITRDQFGYDYAVKHKIFSGKSRAKFQRLILKAGANDNYPFEFGGAHIRDGYIHELSQRAELNLDERTYEPCALYMNGQYWGLYEMREKVDDHDFTSFYYDQPEKDVQFIKTWGGTWAEYGEPNAIPDWNVLQNFIVNNDMSIPANYALAEADFDFLSLVDYMIINTQVVCMDWLNWNTAWWRGLDPNGTATKWRYTLWDMDATFGHYINYTGIPNEGPTADPCDNESPAIDDPEGHTEMLSSLLANPDFYALYINRYADLNNTYFTCDSMLGILDEMITRIEPEMIKQIARWGGSFSDWQDNVQDLRDYITTRCTVIDTGITDCYNVTGPHNLTVIIDPPLSGDVQVNTIIPNTYPYNSDYFSGVPISLEALPQGLNVFDYWEPLNSTLNPNTTVSTVDFELMAGDTIIAHFIVNSACPTLNLVATSTDATCNGSDGTASVTLGGGIGPFDYAWDASTGGQMTATATNLSAGNYTVSVFDTNGCMEVQMATVNASSGTLVLQASSTNASCAGNDGTASVTVAGGTNPLFYAWNTSPIQTNATATGLASGTYEVTVADANGCVAVNTVTVSGSNQFAVQATSTDAICTASNGTASAIPTGGAGPFSYIWDGNAGNQTTSTAIGLSAGNYSFTVSDVNNCLQIGNVTINAAAGNLVANALSTDASCNGNDGTASVITNGGQAPYTYLWNTVPPQTLANINGLAAGNYSVTTTDANGCVVVNTVTINAAATLAASINVQPANCSVGNDGIATGVPTGGTAPFSYTWNTTPVQTAATAVGLIPGLYTVTITDINGCEATQTANVGIIGQLAAQMNSTPTSCIGNDGTATATSTQGLPPFTYEWNTTPLQITPTATGLPAGNYSVTMTDSNGCPALGTVVVQSDIPQSVNVVGTDLQCNGDNSGMAEVTTAGTFNYEWSTGANTAMIDGLAAGTYSVTVSGGICYFVESVTIVEPAAFSAIIITNDNFCTLNGASANVLPQGGIPPFQYEWSTGDSGPAVGGLATGTYDVTITDGSGCSQVSTTSVVSEANGPVLSSTHTNISCTSDNDGSIDLTVNGGAVPYTYDWGNGISVEDLSGLSVGSYTVIVTDANGCLAVTTVTISSPSPMTLNPISTSSSGNDGTAGVTVAGGVPPFTYQWDNGQTSQVAIGLAAGAYTVFVTDANGCTAQTTIEVDAFTGLEDIEGLTTFGIYPNPNSGQFTVELFFSTPESIEIALVNVLGQTLEEFEGKGTKFFMPFNIKDYPSGMYTLMLKTKHGRTSRKVLKLE